MTFGSPHSFPVTRVKHHDKRLTLVFGPDGQFSLIGDDVPSIPIEAPTLVASITDSDAPSEQTSISPLPKLDATSYFVPTSMPTAVASFPASSSYTPTTSTTSTNTFSSVPTSNSSNSIPSPTGVSNSSDHGVGAPFYLAIVLASISFVGCVAAFVAWWIRSRARKRDFDLEDPWHRRDIASDVGSPLADNANELEKGPHKHLEAQTRPYYLPASIVRRNSPDLLAVPHTLPRLEEDALQNGYPHTALLSGRYPSLRHGNGQASQDWENRNIPSSQTASVYSRPSTVRLDTGLSVQESTRTLGRLRITNKVPGDVTSGDEGGMNIRGLQNGAGLTAATNTGGDDNALRDPHIDQGSRPARFEPPGPATYPWGRRTETVAALRRTRRRTPETTAQTYKNPNYGQYLYPTLDKGPALQASDAIDGSEGEKKTLGNLSLDHLGWTNSLKSSFWQAVDTISRPMTGNRALDLEPHVVSTGGGSRFTPAPQRVASRCSPVSATHLASGLSLPSDLTHPPLETDVTYGSVSPVKSTVAVQSSARAIPENSALKPTERQVSQGRDYVPRRLDSLPPKVSYLNRNPGSSTRRRYLDSFMADTGSVCSTDSTVAKANLRKYGYGDPIPSTWSALAAHRESQLDLDRLCKPALPPVPSSALGRLSITPSLLTLESSGLGSSVIGTSMRARTPAHSVSDVTGSDVSTIRSGKHAYANTATDGETRTISTYTMSRNGTIQSGCSTIGHGTEMGTVHLQSVSSTTSSMLSRKKGVATRRKRPRPPARAPSTASSAVSIESGISARDMAVRRALLERRRKVKAGDSLKRHDPNMCRSLE